MRILYIAPRFHTNQIEIMKGWKSRGNEVKFLTYYQCKIEDYTVIRPEVIGFSKFFLLIDWIYVNIIKRNNQYAHVFKIKYGIPPVFRLKKAIERWNPQLIIVRDRTVYSIVAYLFKGSANCILYDQNPYLIKNEKNDFMHKVLYKMTPQYRFTPVYGVDGLEDKNARYIPFVMPALYRKQTTDYLKDDLVKLLFVGKFMPRKNHIMLLNVVKRLLDEGITVKCSIVGEATDRMEIECYEKVVSAVDDLNITSNVTIETNVKPNEMREFYINADIFVIPSTDEPASVSQLEAMAYSDLAIVSDNNGTSCYIKNGYNGFVFHDNDEDDLFDKISMVIQDKEKIIRMGQNAYDYVNEYHSFDKYEEGIKYLMSSISEDGK